MLSVTCNPFMLSVKYKPFILGVIMLSVVALIERRSENSKHNNEALSPIIYILVVCRNLWLIDCDQI